MAKGTNDLTLKVGFDIEKFQAEMNKTTGVLNKWASGVQNSLMGVAASFSLLAIGDFVMDVSKLAGEAEGVRAAFEKLPNSINLMRELKEATHGTVSELDLMKRSVMAANFGINIEALPRLLEFAAVRAKQTGQSVDFLADSIVTGIGRKSALILDNLGISLSAINDELKVTPDYATAVGNIAERELAKMGEMSENAATKTERLGASYLNLKVYLGEVANETGVLGSAIDSLTQKVDLLSSRNLTWYEKLIALINPGANVAAIAKEIAMEAIKASEAQRKHNEIVDTATVLLRDLGLNYEALMNVAGDNANVLEIWAEMQRISSEEAQKLIPVVNTQAEAIRKLNIEFEKSIGLKSIESALQYTNQKFNDPKQFDLAAVTSMSAALDSLRTKNEEVTETIRQQSMAVIENAMAMGQSAQAIGFALGQIATGEASLAQGIARSSMVIIDELQQQALAAIIRNASINTKNPIAAVIMASIGFGAIKALFSKIGRSSGSGGGAAMSGYQSSDMSRIRTEKVGDRIVLEFKDDAGRLLKAKLMEQDRIDSRTRAING